MAVGTLHNNLLSIDEEAILLISSILVTVFYRAEAELLAFYMKRLTVLVF